MCTGMKEKENKKRGKFQEKKRKKEEIEKGKEK